MLRVPTGARGWFSGSSGDNRAVPRVLIVEDEVALAEAVERGLAAEGYSVVVSHDGAEGLWHAREQDFDLIVLDILLPGMNGYQVCRTLRGEGNWTPILMLTAKSGEHDEAEALDTGADDFLTKPFSFMVLSARLRALARRARSSSPAPLRVDDLELDPARRAVRRGAEPVHLSPRELSLLEALLRRAGEPCTKHELLEAVWGEHDVDPNVVEVYVGYLRRKVDRPFSRANIQTVRGFGYRIAPDGRGGATAPEGSDG
jgi:DNA-binding response OmpR family regulator